MKKVIVLGSLNMDLSIACDTLPENGETINGYDFYINTGGKGGNQAVSCAKLGAHTEMIGSIGNDIFGDEILEKLKRYGVETKYITRSDKASSGVAMVICSNHDNRIILGNGANYTLDIAYVKEILATISQPGDIFLTQLENPYPLIQEALIYAKQLSLYTILNPAPAKILDDMIYQNLDMIVVNQSECHMLTGIFPQDERSGRKALHAFAKRHVKAVITLGAKGSIAMENEDFIFIPSKNVEVVDTTGAGDSYIGALCACLTRGTSLKDALLYATKTAAITVTRRGAQISIPYKEEVENFMKEDSYE